MTRKDRKPNLDFASKNRLRRIHPLSTVFWIALLLIILGLLISELRILIIAGIVIVLIYLAYFLVWINDKFS